VVLAAGKSSRMGTAKQLLSLGSGTVLGQTLTNVRNSGLEEIVLVLGSSAESIRRQLPDSLLEDVRIVTNEAYEQGMASSLRAGISAVSPRAEAALVILADQPFIRTETFDRIVEEYRRTHARIVIPMHRGLRGNPVLLDRSVFHEVMALEGDIGCRAIFGSHPDEIVKVEVEDPGILLDIDNQNDYEQLRHFGSGQGGSDSAKRRL
jgi:molybdenum cofactor cytidylyltransferase